MTRLNWLDSLRGFALIFMVSFQILDSLKILDLYDKQQLFYWLGVYGWVIPFWIVSGYSSVLMHRKYGRKIYLQKTVFRFFQFQAIGYFLMIVVPFNISIPMFEEALGSIGLNILLISPLILLKNLKALIVAFPALLTIHYLVSFPFFFSPSFISAFMCFGACLSHLRIKGDLKIPILNFLGRHALKFYVAHYVVIAVVSRI